MKKIKAVAAAMMVLCSSTVFAQEPIRVVIDGTTVVFDQQPMVIEDRTMVPLRGIFEAMGADVDWVAENKTILARKANDIVMLQVGSKTLYRNDTAIPMDVSPVIRGDRVLIPARAVAEAFGAEVLWKAEERTVQVTTSASATFGEYSVTTKTVTLEEKDDNGVTVLTAEYDYPQLSNPYGSSAISQLNAMLEKEAQEQSENFTKQYLESAKKDAQKQGSDFTPYQSLKKIDVTYMKHDVVSVVGALQNQIGGKVIPEYRDAAVYDMKTAKRLEVSDLVRDSESQWKKGVKEALLAMIEQKPNQFYSNVRKKADDAMEKVEFYLVDKGIVFYWNLGIIAPEEKGIFSFLVEMKWDDLNY
ncbi:MAG: DUF4163 domain-containing protein [Epulopiscium sp.]|nr:DUF4163 domain-containing protein [Candidatus Epulonipiscium sp.]